MTLCATELFNHEQEKTDMAKKSTIALSPAYSDGGSFTDLLMVSATPSKVVLIDTAILYTMTLEGDKLKVRDGMITGGTFDTVYVANPDGDPVYKITGISVNANVIDAASLLDFTTGVIQRAIIGDNKLVGTNGADNLESIASVGNDIVFGKGGDDTLDGGTGKDVLIGGRGEDEFVFNVGMSTDMIRDFDANNSDGAQDLIDGTFASATISASANGNDTIVDFGSGDRFILLGVTPGQIDASDFTA
jgi:Ca2+-binding RTX toxin-like protein